jgi:transcription antitermination factor NusG
MPVYYYQVSQRIGGKITSRYDFIEAASADDAYKEIRKLPGYFGCGIQRYDWPMPLDPIDVNLPKWS